MRLEYPFPALYRFDPQCRVAPRKAYNWRQVLPLILGSEIKEPGTDGTIAYDKDRSDRMQASATGRQFSCRQQNDLIPRLQDFSRTRTRHVKYGADEPKSRDR